MSEKTTRLPWAGILPLVLGAGMAAGYWWGHRMPASEHSVAAPQAASRRILYWHDPMVPGQKFDKPGKSPYMDMDLVPVYADEATGDQAVQVGPGVVQNLGIRLGRVERITLTPELHAVGSVAFDEGLLQLVQPRVDGYVERLHVHAPLEAVRRGKALASIVAPQWLEAEREYLVLLDATSGRAREMQASARQRLAVLGVPDPAIRKLEESRTPTAAMVVSAPIDGVVTELGVREGASFSSGTVLFRINGLATVWVNAQIPEAKIAGFPIGSTVAAHASAWPGESFSGRIVALLPQIDSATRTLTARVSLANPGGRLVPGMFVTLDMVGPPAAPQLAIPSEALIVTGERSVVIVARDRGGFDVRTVTTGAEQHGQVTILSGLSAGESIVLSGQFLIDSEASLRSTMNRLGNAPAESQP